MDGQAGTGARGVRRVRAARLSMVGGRATALAGAAGLTAMLGGCAADSFLDPTRVGRWEPTATTVPILERLAVIEGSAGATSVETSVVRPEDLIPEVEAYRVGAGDGLEVRIQDFYREGVEEAFPRAVDARGFVDLPQIGSIYVDGLPVEDLQATIARALVEKAILKDPIVAVQVTAQRRLTFNVIGSVGTPGLFAIPRPDYRLLEALTAAGRFSDSVQSVYVIRQIALTDKVTRGSGPRPAGGARGVPARPRNGEGAPAAGPAGGETVPGKPKESIIDLIDELTKPKPGEGEGQPAAPPPTAPPKPPSVMRGTGSELVMRQPGTKPGEPPPPPVDLDDGKKVPAAQPQGPATGTMGKGVAATKARAVPAPGVATGVPRPPAVPMPVEGAAQAEQPAADGTAGLPDEHWVFRDGRWMKVAEARLLPPVPARPITPPPGAVVEVPEPEPESGPGGEAEKAAPPPLPPAGGPTPVPSVPGAESLVTQRVIEVPVGPLLAGSAQFNIIVRPGDVVRVPSPAEGIVYLTGEVQRPGTFNLPSAGRYTIKRAIASAGGLSTTGIPEKLDLTRMVGPDRQATIRLNLRAIEEGTQPDVFLKPDDILNVGTNFWAYPLAVARNGFRASYGFGFVLDRNFQGDVFGRDRALRP